MANTNKLTASKVGSLRSKDKPYRVSDGGGLYLQVMPTGAKYWRMNYRHDGKQKTAAFGCFPDVSLFDARRARDNFSRVPVAAAVTLQICFEEFVRVKKFGLSLKHQVLIQSRCQPVLDELGSRPVGALRPADFLPALRKIEDRTQTVAKKVRTDFGQCYDYAIACDYADCNPVRDLRHALKPVQGGHRPAIIDPAGVGELLRFLDRHPGMGVIVRHYHLIAPHVFVRPSDLRLSEWDQFDLDGATWSFTMGKMKGKENADLIVPLSRQVVDLLRSLFKFTGHTSYLFASLPDEKLNRPGF